ncbi:MAG: hypothetical protein A3I78_02880 [Gammaproteobacteria bacterium RIFCSPLOWO2_02_FULL_56_15]|nr:MAG: hypothetical protein A3I78_02880 [Gammaproteobacteria bacterium RIFCSPLOWO2_02_FULL_56_15]
MHTQVFARLVKSVAKVNGMPTVRQAFVPQPVVGRSAADLRAYIEGEDAVEGGPFIQRLIDGLTGSLQQDDIGAMSFDRSTPRLLEPDTEENLRDKFEEHRWTDFLPIVLPTEERVAAMLKGTSQAPEQVVGRMQPARFRELWEYTVEKVAVNAVMAGARPEYFPVILALAASGVTARSSSTTSQATLAMVNGPIRNEIGMNAGIGAMGPYNHANATIGRAFGLLSQNLQGGSVPNESFMGSQGNVHSYSAVCAENEERSPWEPFHVQHGRRADESAVSLFMGGWYIQFGGGPRETWEEKFSRSLAACDPFSGPVLALDPLVARGFVDRGFDTKQKLIQWCSENTRIPAREYWDNQWVQTLLLPQAVAGVEPYASHLKADPDQPINMFRPEDISVVVVGGETGAVWKILSGTYMGTVSVDEWR